MLPEALYGVVEEDEWKGAVAGVCQFPLERWLGVALVDILGECRNGQDAQPNLHAL